ncbi:MAG: flavodoxin family protein [Actinobacteria bacterium]|nr:flavodoxin family protein [Actinomycetota bacterium]
MKAERDYLLALYTSPRDKGNTSLLMDALSDGAREAGYEVQDFRVANMDVRPCRACNACFRDGECVQKDDMQEIYPHLLRAGAVAMAAPIFSMNICAQAKALIDRCQRFWSARYVLGDELVERGRVERRRGFFLSCCGRDKPETFDCTRPVMGYFFYIIRVGKWTPLTFAGVDEAGKIREVEGALDAAAELGRSLRMTQ